MNYTLDIQTAFGVPDLKHEFAAVSDNYAVERVRDWVKLFAGIKWFRGVALWRNAFKEPDVRVAFFTLADPEVIVRPPVGPNQAAYGDDTIATTRSQFGHNVATMA